MDARSIYAFWGRVVILKFIPLHHPNAVISLTEINLLIFSHMGASQNEPQPVLIHLHKRVESFRLVKSVQLMNKVPSNTLWMFLFKFDRPGYVSYREFL